MNAEFSAALKELARAAKQYLRRMPTAHDKQCVAQLLNAVASDSLKRACAEVVAAERAAEEKK